MNRPHILLASLVTLIVIDAARLDAHDPSADAAAAAETTPQITHESPPESSSEAAPELTAEEIARQDQNPITRFYVMRFENNTQLGFGPNDEALNFFRFQPLVPVKLGEDWTLLTRLIIPLVHQPWPQTNDGLGDISAIAFLTPARSGKFIWGLGPGFLLPTATKPELGTERFSAGPAVAGVYTSGPWVVGVVAQNLWSFAGDNDRLDVELMTLRPLLNYNLPRGWFLTTSPSIVANWETDENNDRWLVPVGAGVGKVFTIGRQRMSTTVESYYHVEAPKIGPEWQMRLQLSFLYPD